MNKIQYCDIKGLHLELTTKCNAMCPMCARNFRGKVRQNLALTELSLAECKKILSVRFLKQLEFISICGVFGDPINCSDLLEILRYIYDINANIFINLYTNGAIKSVDWWRKLAAYLLNGCVIFGIDGMDDTSSIYRVYTNVRDVLRNARAFIEAGGRAKWDFIAFKHNEMQIAAAKRMSEELGFVAFEVKKTSRFFKTLYEKDELLESTHLEYGRYPVYNANGKIIYYLELPNQLVYRNNGEEKLLEIIDKYGGLDQYFASAHINCQAIKTHGIFISAFGDVFPCCTVYQQYCYGEIFHVQDQSELNEYKIWKAHGNTSALNYTIEEIVDGRAFNELQTSWKLKTIQEGKPKACCRACGMEVDFHAEQHSCKRN